MSLSLILILLFVTPPLRRLPLTHVHPCTELGVPQLLHIFTQIRASKHTPSRALSVKGGGKAPLMTCVASRRPSLCAGERRRDWFRVVSWGLRMSCRHQSWKRMTCGGSLRVPPWSRDLCGAGLDWLPWSILARHRRLVSAQNTVLKRSSAWLMVR